MIAAANLKVAAFSSFSTVVEVNVTSVAWATNDRSSVRDETGKESLSERQYSESNCSRSVVMSPSHFTVSGAVRSSQVIFVASACPGLITLNISAVEIISEDGTKKPATVE